MDYASTSRYNPWIWMWVRPAETMRQILESGRTREVLLLAAVVGIQNALWVAEQESLGDHGPTSVILLLGSAIGALSGVVSVYLTAGLLTWLGRWLGGEGTGPRLRAAVAWSGQAWAHWAIRSMPSITRAHHFWVKSAGSFSSSGVFSLAASALAPSKST